jgi:hypothetical protein
VTVLDLNSDEVVVAGTGAIYVGDVGTPFPTSISDPIDTDDWIGLGYISEEGPEFEFARDINEIMAWQSYDPIRIANKVMGKTVGAKLLQWNKVTWDLANGGGSTSEVLVGEYEYEPPLESFVDTRAFLVVGIDGDREYRFGFRKALNIETFSFSFVRENPVKIPIKFKVLAAPNGDRPFILQHNDAALGEPNDTVS